MLSIEFCFSLEIKSLRNGTLFMGLFYFIWCTRTDSASAYMMYITHAGLLSHVHYSRSNRTNYYSFILKAGPIPVAAVAQRKCQAQFFCRPAWHAH